MSMLMTPNLPQLTAKGESATLKLKRSTGSWLSS